MPAVRAPEFEHHSCTHRHQEAVQAWSYTNEDESSVWWGRGEGNENEDRRPSDSFDTFASTLPPFSPLAETSLVRLTTVKGLNDTYEHAHICACEYHMHGNVHENAPVYGKAGHA